MSIRRIESPGDEDNVLDNKEQKEQRMLDEFEWNEDPEVPDEKVDHPIYITVAMIMEFARALCDHVFKNISTAELQGSSFTFSIPKDIHLLSIFHFDPQIEENSRYEVFVLLQYVTQQLLEDEYQYKIEAALQNMLPGNMELRKVELIDDLEGLIEEDPGLYVVLHVKNPGL